MGSTPVGTATPGAKKPFSVIDAALKVVGACSAFAPLLVRTLDVLPIRPALSGWLPWLSVAAAFVAALIGMFVVRIDLRKSTIALGVSIVVYVLLVVAFPTPPTYDRLLLAAFTVSYLGIFASFSFLVGHIALRLAERYGDLS